MNKERNIVSDCTRRNVETERQVEREREDGKKEEGKKEERGYREKGRKDRERWGGRVRDRGKQDR